jgi:hypothetical protein
MRHYELEQGTPDWFALRTGKVTGSMFGRLVKSNWLELVDQIVAEQLTGINEYNSVFENDDMIRGRELEPIAIEQYTSITGIEIDKCGFIQSEKYPIFGCSPDGITKVGNGIIEVKSPRAKIHIKNIRHGKIPSDHIGQIMSYFIVDPAIQFVDFISFCPDLEVKPIWIKRIERIEAEETIAEYETALDKFSKAVDKLKNDLTF